MTWTETTTYGNERTKKNRTDERLARQKDKTGGGEKRQTHKIDRCCKKEKANMSGEAAERERAQQSTPRRPWSRTE
jgi:hypothetical protein